MARMSIDDMFLRDPRVRALANALGWNKYEARGRLLDVYAVVYDRVDAGGDGLLSALEIDTAAEFPGLADAMIVCNLAERTRRGVRVKGGNDRTKYLATRESSGRTGGIKSGESRRNKSKVTFAENEGRLNPSVSLHSPSASAVVPDNPTASAIAIAPSAPREKSPELLVLEAKVDAVAGTKRGRPTKNSVPMPPDWKPRGQETATAIELGVDCFYQSEKFRDWHSARGSRFVDWDAAFRTWLRNAVEFGKGRGSSTAKTPLEQQIERVRMLEEQERAESERAT